MWTERLELSRSKEQWILSPLCLPIPPCPRNIKTIAGFEPASRRVAAYCLEPLGYIANVENGLCRSRTYDRSVMS
jgi:hypothetical protein